MRLPFSPTTMPALLAAAFAIHAVPVQAFEPIVTHYGLGTFIHPLQKPDCPPGPSENCCKDHVYIFVVNGMNPLCLGNLNGLCDYLREQGYNNTCFTQLHTSGGIPARVRQVHHDDPQARIVLIGFSCGCNVVRYQANLLAEEGIKIELLVYIVGDYITNCPYSYPSNVCRVLNIRGKGFVLSGGDLFWNGADLDGARNCNLGVRHMLAPSRRETIELVMEELNCVACKPVCTPPIIPPLPSKSAIP